MKFTIITLFVSLLLGLLYPNISEAQLWYRYRHEVFAGIGASQMLGDLGGGSGDAKRLGDINIGATNFGGTIGYRYKVSPKAALRFSTSYLILKGDDALTSNEGRKSRNLSVRTRVIEFTPMIEYYLVSDDIPKTTRYRGGSYRGGMKGSGPSIGLYIATGISVFSYNPTAELNGTTYDLRDLGTEGQGLEPGSEKYSTVDIALPVNIGFRINFDQYWSATLEAAARFTATDYLDDVSTDYYDNAEIAQAYGSEAALLADRRENTSGQAGGIRGNPDNNDAYFYLQIHIAKRIKSYRSPSGKRRPTF